MTRWQWLLVWLTPHDPGEYYNTEPYGYVGGRDGCQKGRGMFGGWACTPECSKNRRKVRYVVEQGLPRARISRR